MHYFTVKKGKLAKKQLKEVIGVLKRGGIIVYPTETIYGLGCNAFDKIAAKKIFDIKGRNKTKVASVMVANKDQIKQYAEIGELDNQFLDKYLPGPVTVILKGRKEYLGGGGFVTEVKNKNGGIGFRVASDNFPFLGEILKQVGFPVLSTSANKSGAGIQEANIGYVTKELGKELDQVEVVLDAGDLNNNIPSTVVDLTTSPYTVVRWGMENIDINDLKKVNK